MVSQAVDLSSHLQILEFSQTNVSITTAFPDFVVLGHLVWTLTAKAVHEGLHPGCCDFLVSKVITLDAFQNDDNSNGNCAWAWIGHPFQGVMASLAVKSDAGTLCALLLANFQFALA